jgi:hypothetical protein
MISDPLLPLITPSSLVWADTTVLQSVISMSARIVTIPNDLFRAMMFFSPVSIFRLRSVVQGEELLYPQLFALRHCKTT